jgi:hypothetical protein
MAGSRHEPQAVVASPSELRDTPKQPRAAHRIRNGSRAMEARQTQSHDGAREDEQRQADVGYSYIQ